MSRLKFDTIVIPTVHAPFGGDTGDLDFVVESENLTGAAAVISFAAAQGGSALFTALSTGSANVTVTWDAGYVNDGGMVVGATTIRGTISEATLEALSWGQIPPDEPLEVWCDVLVTPSGGTQQYLCDGPVHIFKGIGD